MLIPITETMYATYRDEPAFRAMEARADLGLRLLTFLTQEQTDYTCGLVAGMTPAFEATVISHLRAASQGLGRILTMPIVELVRERATGILEDMIGFELAYRATRMRDKRDISEMSEDEFAANLIEIRDYVESLMDACDKTYYQRAFPSYGSVFCTPYPSTYEAWDAGDIRRACLAPRLVTDLANLLPVGGMLPFARLAVLGGAWNTYRQPRSATALRPVCEALSQVNAERAYDHVLQAHRNLLDAAGSDPVMRMFSPVTRTRQGKPALLEIRQSEQVPSAMDERLMPPTDIDFKAVVLDKLPEGVRQSALRYEDGIDAVSCDICDAYEPIVLETLTAIGEVSVRESTDWILQELQWQVGMDIWCQTGVSLAQGKPGFTQHILSTWDLGNVTEGMVANAVRQACQTALDDHARNRTGLAKSNSNGIATNLREYANAGFPIDPTIALLDQRLCLRHFVARYGWARRIASDWLLLCRAEDILAAEEYGAVLAAGDLHDAAAVACELIPVLDNEAAQAPDILRPAVARQQSIIHDAVERELLFRNDSIRGAMP